MAEVRLVETDADREAAYRVRHEVFVGEQGVPPEIERDAADDTADHAVAYDGGTAVGAGRLVARGEAGVVGRMAVLAGARGRGIGGQVLDCLERRARDRGLARIELNAQARAADFYRNRGYVPAGEPYQEVGIPHLPMRKDLSE